MAKKRSYSDSFLKYGFVSIVDQGIEKPQCVLRTKVLSPKSMKPSKLKRHLETKHTYCKDKDLSFFEQKANCVKRSRMDSSGVFQQQNRAAVEATFVVSLRIAKAKKPHTIAEQLILPCAKDINCILIGKKAESKVNALSLSDNTVQRRISLMSEDIQNQVIDHMKSAGSAVGRVHRYFMLCTTYCIRTLRSQWSIQR